MPPAHSANGTSPTGEVPTAFPVCSPSQSATVRANGGLALILFHACVQVPGIRARHGSTVLVGEAVGRGVLPIGRTEVFA